MGTVLSEHGCADTYMMKTCHTCHSVTSYLPKDMGFTCTLMSPICAFDPNATCAGKPGVLVSEEEGVSEGGEGSVPLNSSIRF